MLKKIFIIILGIVLSSCIQRIYQVDNANLSDGKYDSEFPSQNCSKQIKEISESVKMLNCMVIYRTYFFSRNDSIRENEIEKAIKANKMINETFDHEPVSGTATIISTENNKIVLLTCAHIIDFPDRLVTKFTEEDRSEQYIQSVAYKQNMNIYINDIPNGNKLEIIAVDNEKDIALLGTDLGLHDDFIPVFNYKIGKARELEWGCFLYIMGYPLGNKMITSGIVSDPDGIKHGSFIIDALFNKGFSGGLVFAIRDGIPNFELVGIAKSVSAEHRYELIPEKEQHEFVYNPRIPYEGALLVRTGEDINYGITYAIPIEEIVEFIKYKRPTITQKGYNLDKFLKKN